jgi:hypothetical protein
MSSAKPQNLVPDWIAAVAMLVLPLLLAFNVAYLLGASGMRISGSSMSFNREYDDTVYRLADGLGMEVDEYSMRVVRVEPGIPPINPVCGVWDAREIVMNNPTFIQDGVLLADEYYEWETPGGIELATGAILDIAALQARGLPLPTLWVDPSERPSGAIPARATPGPAIPPKPPRPGGDGTKPDANAPIATVAPPAPHADAAAPGYVATSSAPREPITRELVTANYDKLRVINESCITFNAAFVAIYLLLGIIAAPIAATRYIRRRRAA